MKLNDTTFAAVSMFLFGLALGVVTGTCYGIYKMSRYFDTPRQMKAACEKPLPRTQHCVMAYVPEKQEKNP